MSRPPYVPKVGRYEPGPPASQIVTWPASGRKVDRFAPRVFVRENGGCKSCALNVELTEAELEFLGTSRGRKCGAEGEMRERTSAWEDVQVAMGWTPWDGSYCPGWRRR